MEYSNISENYYEVARFLMGYPFNTSQVGYNYLIEAITMVLDTGLKRMRLGKDIYAPLAERRNVGVKHYEKSIREVLQTVSHNCYNNKELQYPNCAIKNVFIEPTAKSFIYAVVSQILLDRKAHQFKSSK